MVQTTVGTLADQCAGQIGSGSVLEQILRDGARKMLAEAIEAEVNEYLQARSHLTDDTGRQQVVRNGHMPERQITTPLGDVNVQQPRVRDRRGPEEAEKFTSAILPPYLRKTQSVEELIPWLYLRGVSTGDFTEALRALLGPQAKGLSATTVTRLKESWQAEYQQWCQRSLADKHYVYVWADGVYFNIRLEDEPNKKQCILVLLGATSDGSKELIGLTDGYRESEQSWAELLQDVQSRGLAVEPNLVIGDGNLGLWKAIGKIWPTARWQRCWVHKTANVLNKLPKSMQGKAKSMLREIWQAPTKAKAEEAFDAFTKAFRAKYPKAVECLEKDRDVLLTFFELPAEHWVHVRTTNPIESIFSTVRLRTERTKGSGSRDACLTMVFKLMQSASQGWRRLKGSQLISDVIGGTTFVDGIKDAA